MKKEMKKNLFMVAAVALMAMISCNKEQINGTLDVQEPAEDVIADIPFEFSAYADGADTQAPSVNPASVQQKTTLNTTGDKPKTHWLATDKISVNGFEFSVDKETAYGESARFLGQVSESFAAPYKAVYPASAGSFDALEVPAVQTAVAGDFDQSAVIGVAYSEKDNTLAFKNVTSLLKFQVSAACDQVTITSDVALAGTIKVNAVKVEKGDNGLDVTTIDYTVLTAKKEITVNGPFVTGKDYYVAVLPGAKTNFAVRVDGYFSRGAASVTPKRNVIMDMKTLPEPVASGWCVKGSFNNWGEGYSLFNDLNGNIVAKNIKLSGAFKIVNPSDKYVRSISNTPTTSKWLTLYDASGDMSLTGTYDVYVNTASKAICMVTASSSVPEYKLSNRELYVSVQSGWGWPYLYGWEGTNTEIWDGWQTRKYDTSLTISNTGYYCWKVPANFNNKTVSLIASKTGEQAPTKSGVALTQDRFYELKYTNKVEFNEVTAPTF